MKEMALKIAGIIFLFVSIMHLLRLVLKIEIVIGGIIVPLWASAAGFVVALCLALWMFGSLKK